MNCEIMLAFADGEYRFFLGTEQIRELQDKCGIGIGGLFSRIMKGRYLFDGDDGPEEMGLPHQSEFRLEDIAETIRLGLIGGGMGSVNGAEVKLSPIAALQLVNRYVHGKPLMPSWQLASSILNACIIGYEDKKKEPQQPDQVSEPTDSSTSDKS